MKRIIRITVTALGLLAFAGVAIAAEQTGHGGAEHHYDWTNFLLRIANFVIVAGIIWYFAGGKIKDYLKTRRYNIENELAELDQRKKDADKRLKDVEKGIANMEQEREKILDDYRAQGEALKASIIEHAEKSAQQIRDMAKATAETESRMAVESIREQLADMVAEATQKVLEERLTKEEHQKLIDKYLTKVVLN